MLRLNLGCGGAIAEGWVNVDRRFLVNTETGAINDGCGPQRVVSAENGGRLVVADNVIAFDITQPWPWADGSVEGIVMHHVADLLTADEDFDVLRKCHRVLEPGGVLRVSCADITLGIERAMAGDWSWFPEPQEWEEAFDRHMAHHGIDGQLPIDLAKTLGSFILQGGARKQFLTEMSMCEALQLAGFQADSGLGDGETMYGESWITELDSRPDESWFVEAKKRR